MEREPRITYWTDGVVTYTLRTYALLATPSDCEWIVPGFWHEHE